jgi:hypothetical protein
MKDEINKTIVVSYDDATRMIDFCCDENGVTKDFMDWYVNENAFFSKTGIFIIENVSCIKKFTIAFNFNNPDNPEFTLYDYNTQKNICEYTFNRENNLSMDKISVDVNFYDKTLVKNLTKIASELQNIILTKDLLMNVEKQVISSFNLLLKKKTKVKSSKALQKQVIEEWVSKGELLKLYNHTAIKSVYFCYAAMYFFSKNKSQEVTGITKNNLSNDGIIENIITKYKYTGYVNLNKITKIYKPIINKDDNEPTREYGRHIEQWSVRGHYRRIKGNLIWIEPHVKGEGNLEKRIYGTENESDVNIYPKVFDVNRKVIIRDTDEKYITPCVTTLEEVIKPITNNEQATSIIINKPVIEEKQYFPTLKEEIKIIPNNEPTELIIEEKQNKQSFIKRIIKSLIRLFKI